MPAALDRSVGPRIVAIALVVLLHVTLAYVLLTARGPHVVEPPRLSVVTTIIDVPSPPAPAPKQAPPPPRVVVAPRPPPLPPLPKPVSVPQPVMPAVKPPPPRLRPIHVRKPSPKPMVNPVSHPVAPPAPPVMVAAPKPPPPHPSVRVLPRIDRASSQAPEYPAVARELGEQGIVVLDVLVDAAGRAVDAKILHSSGFPPLDAAAIASVKTTYRFVPGTVDGRPQPMWFRFAFTWKLE